MKVDVADIKKMGGKKKGLANRLAKMSDDERARYLQHRLDMEEEARRRKEQLISTFLKNKIEKEDGFARLNLAKINQNWHQILRKSKCKEMKELVAHMAEAFERVFEMKNRTIQNLLHELEDSDEQYMNNFQSHLIHINDIIEFSQKSVEELNEQYESDYIELIEAAKQEQTTILKKAYENTAYLKTVGHQQEETSKKELRDRYEYYLQRTDDVMRENKKEFDEVRRSKEYAIADLWRQIASVVRDYVERTDTKRAHLAELHALDAESAAEIARNEEIIKRKEAEIIKLEQDLEDLTTSRKEELAKLNGSIGDLKKIFLHSKQQLQKDLAFDEKQLILLTDSSNIAIKHLEKLYSKGQRLLKLGQTCRKFETEKEKIVRFAQNVVEEDLVLEKEDSENSALVSIISDNSKAKEVKSKIIAKFPQPSFSKLLRPKTGIKTRHILPSISQSVSSIESFSTKSSKPPTQISKCSPSRSIKSTHSFKSSSSTLSYKSASSLRSVSSIKTNSSIKSTDFELEPSEILMKYFPHLECLNTFWISYNNVFSNYVEMREEKCFLLKDNARLKEFIRNVLEAAAMEEDVCKERKMGRRKRLAYSAPIYEYVI